MDYLTMDENVCPVCGKQFYTVTGREWGWSYKGSKYCTYHCMRHVEVRHRVRMGWQHNTLAAEVTLSPDAKAVADALRRVRAVQRAAHTLLACEVQGTTDHETAVRALTKRVCTAGEDMLSRYLPYLDRLPPAQKRLAYALFVDAEAVDKVCAELDMDTDLLAVKVCHIYEALAEAGA